jgi:[ribosomal protein S18]-alanine N-acetyltransferase
MQPSDIKAVMAIDKLSFPNPWKESAYLYEVTGNRLASYQVLTVQLGDRPAELVGYAGYWLIADEIHISTIATAPAWRGRGLGELLLLNLLFTAGDVQARLVTLEVRRGNQAAQALYGKYRFVVIGERPRYYQNAEDAILMTVEPIDSAYRSFLNTMRESLYHWLQEKRRSAELPAARVT